MRQYAKEVLQAFGYEKAIRAVAWFVAVGVMAYIAALFWLGWHETLQALLVFGWPTLLTAALVSSTTYLWRFGRWEYSLTCMGYSIPRFHHLGVYLSGLALTATPGKAGETFRSALLLRKGVKVADSLAAFLADRASDVLGMCLLGGFAAWLVGHPLTWIWVMAFSMLFAISLLLARTLLHPRVGLGWLRIALRWRALPFNLTQQVFESWASLWNLHRVTIFSFVALFAYGSQAAVFAWFCHLADTGITTANCVLIFVQATLFGAASMLPGGLGAMETALVLQLMEHRVDSKVALSLAIAIRLVTLWFGMLVGAVALTLVSSQSRHNP